MTAPVISRSALPSATPRPVLPPAAAEKSSSPRTRPRGQSGEGNRKRQQKNRLHVEHQKNDARKDNIPTGTESTRRPWIPGRTHKWRSCPGPVFWAKRTWPRPTPPPAAPAQTPPPTAISNTSTSKDFGLFPSRVHLIWEAPATHPAPQKIGEWIAIKSILRMHSLHGPPLPDANLTD